MKKNLLFFAIILVCSYKSFSAEDPKLYYFDAQNSALKCINYFKGNYKDITNPDAVVLLDQLQQLYSLNFDIRSKVNTPAFDEFNASFKKLYDTSFVVHDSVFRKVVVQTNSFNSNSVKALYCNQYPLDTSFIHQLAVQSAKGGYYTTHAGFQLQLAINNGCFSDTDIVVKEYKKQLAQQLKAVVTADIAKQDICIEAMAVLSYIGYGNFMEREWLKYLLQTQNSDGGWKALLSDTKSSAHTSALALWVWLEASRNNRPLFDKAETDKYKTYNETVFDSVNRVLLTVNYFLAKRFNVMWEIDFVKAIYGTGSKYDRFNPFLFRYLKAIQPSYTYSLADIDAFCKSAGVFQKSFLSIYSLHCSNLAYNDSLIEEKLRISETKDNDYLMDLALCYNWAYENKCDSLILKLKQHKIKDLLVAKLADNYQRQMGVNTGMALEALAMLYYLGEGKQIKPEWVEAVRKKMDNLIVYGRDKFDDDRVPVYGYWIILESSRTPKQVPWINR